MTPRQLKLLCLLVLANLTLKISAQWTDKLPTPDGRVYAIKSDNNKVYIGGSFNTVGHLIPFVPYYQNFANDYPQIGINDFFYSIGGGSILNVISDGGSGYFVSGTFTTIFGHIREGLARLNANGTLDTNWNANGVGNRQMAVHNGYLYCFEPGPQANDTSYLVQINISNPSLINKIPFTIYNRGIYYNHKNTIMQVNNNTLYIFGTSWDGGKGYDWNVNFNLNTLKPIYMSFASDAVGTYGGAIGKVKQRNDTLYFGGRFTVVGKEVAGSVAFNQYSTSPITSWPKANSVINDIIPDTAGLGYFVTGGFTFIGDKKQSSAAHILSNNSIDPTPLTGVGGTRLYYYSDKLYSFNSNGIYNYISFKTLSSGQVSNFPFIGGYIYDVKFHNGKMYVAGNSLTINGISYGPLAVLDTNGTIPQWTAPVITPGTSTLYQIQPDGNNLYIAGNFTAVNGTARNSMALIKIANGSLVTTFDAKINAGGNVTSFIIDGSNIYLSGFITSLDGTARVNAAKISKSTGALIPAWNPAPTWPIVQFGKIGTELAVTGDFINIGGQAIKYIALLNKTNGAANANWNLNLNRTPRMLCHNNQITLWNVQMYDCVARNALAAFSTTQNKFIPAFDSKFKLNSVVSEIEFTKNEIAVGGLFDSIDGMYRKNIAIVKRNNGSLNSVFKPIIPNSVSSIVALGDSLVVSGYFVTVNNVPIKRLCLLMPNGTLDTAWSPNPHNAPLLFRFKQGVLLSHPNLYFKSETRKGVFAYDQISRKILPFNPSIDYQTVYAIAIKDSTVYLGGDFTGVNGVSRYGLASINKHTGSLNPLNITGYGSSVSALEVSGNKVFIGGFFSIVNHPINNLACLTNGVLDANFTPQPNSTVTALKMFNSKLTVGGGFTTIGSSSKTYLCQVDTITGAATAWAPTLNASVSAIDASATKLYIGGYFTSVNGQTRGNLASFNLPSLSLTQWNPTANATVTAISLKGDKVYVCGSFTALNSVTRNQMGALNATSGASLPLFQPSPKSSPLLKTMYAIHANCYDVIAGGIYSYSNGKGLDTCLYSANEAVKFSASITQSTCPDIANAAISLNATSLYNPLTYLWSNGITTAGISAVLPNTYTVTVTDNVGCAFEKSYTPTSINAPPTAKITALDTTSFCAGDSCRLQANTGANLSYQWKRNNTNIASANTNKHTALIAGTYKVLVTNTVTGCTKLSAAKVISITCREAATLSDHTFTLYPNPASDQLTITGTQPNDLVLLYNMQGQVVMRFVADASSDEQLIVPLSHLPRAYYTVSLLRDSKLIATRKLAVID